MRLYATCRGFSQRNGRVAGLYQLLLRKFHFIFGIERHFHALPGAQIFYLATALMLSHQAASDVPFLKIFS